MVRAVTSELAARRRLALYVQVAALFALVVGLYSLGGWLFHVRLLTGSAAAFTSMKPNTAVVVCLLAVSLWLKHHAKSPLIGNLLALCALAITALTVMEYATARNLGIDQALRSVPLEDSGDPAGRMAPGTAIVGILASLGLLVLDSLPAVSTVFAGLASFLALSAVTGYAFDAGPLLGVPVLRSMSLRTAVTFAAINSALLAARPDREPLQSLLFAVRSHRFGVRVLAGICTLPFLLGLPISLLLRRGYIDATFALALLIVLLTGIQALLVVRNTGSLARVEKERNTSEERRLSLAVENERVRGESEASALKASSTEDLYKLITDSLPACIAYLDTELRYRRVNRLHATWFATGDPGAVVGRSLEAVLGDSAASVRPRLQEALRGYPQTFENQIVTTEGSKLLQLSYMPDRDPSGSVRGVIVQGFDVTAERNATRREKENDERLRLAQRASNLATWDWNLVTGEFTWDKEGPEVYGRPIASLTHVDQILTLVHPDDIPALQVALAPSLEAGEEFHHEFRVVWPDESVHWLIGRGRPLLNQHQRPVRIVGVNLDITARRQTEAALLQSEKLAAVGRLASTIAHELNNPLEAVTNLLYLAHGSTALAEAQSYIAEAEGELRRAAAITNQTLRFNRQAAIPTLLSPQALIDSALGLHQSRLAKFHIQVESDVRGEAAVFCYEGELRQVLNNLIGNAIDAMPSGGTLYLRSRPATEHSTRRAGLQIAVGDTGTGMSATTLKKLFDPFYTTKGQNGSGLGLWVSKEIVERHHGLLRVRSSQQLAHHGTLFTIFLPSERS